MIKVYAIIGKGYGDEGKGLAVDHFCRGADAPLVIRHNGGAQSGHTVEEGEKRFVFHQLSSGSFRGADTFWAETFYPDLYKLQDEIDAFRLAGGRDVRIFCDCRTPVVLIDDVLVNMALETARGNKRHGSCGMGIYEADLRTKAGFGVCAADFLSGSAEELVRRLSRIRREYLPLRLEEAGLPQRPTICTTRISRKCGNWPATAIKMTASSAISAVNTSWSWAWNIWLNAWKKPINWTIPSSS